MTSSRAGAGFPLPSIASPYPSTSRSRRLRQRANRAFHATKLANRAIAALNWLSSPSCIYPPPPPSVQFLSRTKNSFLSHVYTACQRFVSRLHSPSSDDILHPDILPSYSQSQRMVPIVADQIALPTMAGTVDLLDLLPPDLACRYSGPAELLKPPALIQASPCTYVHGPHSQYIALLKRMAAAGMISYTTQPIVVNGLFATPKGDGKLRLIIDARPANSVFVDPPPVVLPTPDLLSKLEVPSGCNLFVAKVDLENFYHRIRLPSWMWSYFALPPVKAGEMGLDCDASISVWPCCTTLPMGWAHAVLLAQTVHENVLNTVPGLSNEDRISAISDSKVDRVRHMIYIDDYCCSELTGMQFWWFKESTSPVCHRSALIPSIPRLCLQLPHVWSVWVLNWMVFLSFLAYRLSNCNDWLI
jgi:hypothetical protein